MLSLLTDTAVAVAQGTGQSSHNLLRAAASILADLVADLVSSLFTNAFISIVESVDESDHDFWVADAVELVAELVNSLLAVLGVASSHRLVDQFSQLARIVVAAFSFDAAALVVCIAAVVFAAAIAARTVLEQVAEQTAAAFATAGVAAIVNAAVAARTVLEELAQQSAAA